MIIGWIASIIRAPSSSRSSTPTAWPASIRRCVSR